MSPEVTEPKSLPSGPALAGTVMTIGTSLLAIAVAASRAEESRVSRALRMRGSLIDRAVAGDEGMTLRQQEVASVSSGHLDDVATLAEAVEI